MPDRSPPPPRLPVGRLVILALLVLAGVVLFFLLAPRMHPMVTPSGGGALP